MRIAYDSTNPYAIPLTARIAWGYIDGDYKWSPAGIRRFGPDTWVGLLTVTGETPHADGADIEQGDLGAAGALSWLKYRRHVGITQKPTLYAPGGLWPEIDRLCEPEFGGHYYRWLADPTGRPHRWSQHPQASVQYFWGHAPEDYDLTAVYGNGRYVVGSK